MAIAESLCVPYTTGLYGSTNLWCHNHSNDSIAGAAYIFIENVGNMAYPAGHVLGEHRSVVLLSLSEWAARRADRFRPVTRGAASRRCGHRILPPAGPHR